VLSYLNFIIESCFKLSTDKTVLKLFAHKNTNVQQSHKPRKSR